MSPSLCVLDLDAGVFLSSFTANSDNIPNGSAAGAAISSSPNAGQSPNRLPQPFLDDLSRRIGAAANAQRVSSQRIFAKKVSSGPSSRQINASDRSSTDRGLTGVVLAEIGQAMRTLLGPRHLPDVSLRNDEDEEIENWKDKGWLPVNVVKRAEQSARDKLKRGVISEVTWSENLS